MRANTRRSTPRAAVTPLRRSFEHARTLDPRTQIDACVEQLTCPWLLAEQVVEACRTHAEHLRRRRARRERTAAYLRERSSTARHPTAEHQRSHPRRRVLLGDARARRARGAGLLHLPRDQRRPARPDTGRHRRAQQRNRLRRPQLRRVAHVRARRRTGSRRLSRRSATASSRARSRPSRRPRRPPETRRRAWAARRSAAARAAARGRALRGSRRRCPSGC